MDCKILELQILPRSVNVVPPQYERGLKEGQYCGVKKERKDDQIVRAVKR